MNILFKLFGASLIAFLVGCGGSEKTSNADDLILKQNELAEIQGLELNSMTMSTQGAISIDDQIAKREIASTSGHLSNGSDTVSKLQTDGNTRKGDLKNVAFHPSRVILTLKAEKIGGVSPFEKNSVGVKNKINLPGFEFSSLSGGPSENKAGLNKLQANEESNQTFVATITNGSTVANAIKKLKESPLVIDAEPDYIWKKQAVPNDPLYVNQWFLKNNGAPGSPPGLVGFDIGAEAAWDYPRSASNIVAIIDDGVKTDHPDLVGSIWTNTAEIAGNSIDDDGDGLTDNVYGADFGNMDGNPNPDFFTSSHGTSIAGIIAATPNNNLGISGISWNSKIMPIKIEDNDGGISTSYLLMALNFVRAKRLAGLNVRVINFSLGTSKYSAITRDTFKSVTDAGILVVVAAGNEGLNAAHNRTYPGSFGLPGVINVGASNSSGTYTGFSNYGSDVDIFAPGENMQATTILAAGESGYGFFSGTSFASPVVAGVAADLWARFPADSLATIKNKLLAGGKISIAGSPSLVKSARTNRHVTMLNETFPCTGTPEILRQLQTTNVLTRDADHLVEALLPRCVQDVNRVSAATLQSSVKTLKDDGIFPDRLAGDGIYSGSVVPRALGLQNLSVTNSATGASATASITVGAAGNYIINKSPLNKLTFQSIAASGVKLDQGDDTSVAVTPPFPVPYYGLGWGTIYVSSNGRICFRSFSACRDNFYWLHPTQNGDQLNAPIPAGRQSNRSLGYLAPWWFDWRNTALVNSPSVGVFTRTTGVSPNRKFIVSWEGMRAWGDTATSSTGNNFQVVFSENSVNIDFVYGSLLTGMNYTNGAKGTIGIQYLNGMIGTQMSFDQASTALAQSNHRYEGYSRSFTDTGSSAWKTDIEGLRGSGLTPGCAGVGGTTFCPEASVSRGSMAVWIIKGLKGNSYQPVASHFFLDEPTSLGWGPYMDELKRLGLSPGCQGEGGSLFCPFAEVSRGSLSVWLVKGLMGSSFVPRAPTGVFVDSPVAHVWTPYIELFRLMGISPGCSGEGGNIFCTNSSITRAASAAWLQRAFRFFDYDAVQ